MVALLILIFLNSSTVWAQKGVHPRFEIGASSSIDINWKKVRSNDFHYNNADEQRALFAYADKRNAEENYLKPGFTLFGVFKYRPIPYLKVGFSFGLSRYGYKRIVLPTPSYAVQTEETHNYEMLEGRLFGDVVLMPRKKVNIILTGGVAFRKWILYRTSGRYWQTPYPVVEVPTQYRTIYPYENQHDFAFILGMGIYYRIRNIGLEFKPTSVLPVTYLKKERDQFQYEGKWRYIDLVHYFHSVQFSFTFSYLLK